MLCCSNYAKLIVNDENQQPKVMRNSRLRLILSLVCGFFLWNSMASQVKGRVRDALSNEPLAFVAIFEMGTQNGTYSDIDGFFELKSLSPSAKIAFHYVGYEVKQFEWDGSQELIVKLRPVQKELAEVVIRAGENPAERIIRQAIENKDENNPERSFGFKYESYNKLYFDLLPDTLSPSWDSLQTDTSVMKDVDFLKSMHLFLIESVSERKFLPPNNSEEKIVASRVSGLKSPDFALLGTQLQSFSFYGEYVEILSSKYLSPLAGGATKKYLFIIEDTTLIDQDTVFTISFRPRKGKNFEGMKGQLFINTDGYALQNVIAEPFEQVGGLQIKIQQRYEKVEKKAWFPIQLNSFIILPIQVDGFVATGEGRSYLQNIQLNPPLRALEFTPVTLMMDKNAFNQPDSVWRKYRPYALDSLDLKTYKVVDSLGQAENLDAKLKVLNALATGKVPVGPFDIELNRIMRFNDYEGFRLGAGFRTNDKLSPYYSVGGYWAYGFKDKSAKYGGDALIHLYRKRDAYIRFIYENDVREVGGNQMEKQGQMFLLNNIYPFFVNRMDRYERMELRMNGRAIRNFTVTGFANQQFVKPYKQLAFNTVASDLNGGGDVLIRQVDFQLVELGGQVRWAPGEKLARVGNREVRLFGRYPVIQFKYTRGSDVIGEGDFAYERYDAMIEKTFLIKNMGTTSMKLIGGFINGTIPLTLNYNARGTYDNFGIFSPDAFETMRTNEFMHDRFVAFHFRHSFKDLLFKRPKFRPQLVLVHSMMVGDMSEEKSSRYDLPLAKAVQGYYESGLQIDRLVVSNFSGLGIGAFYRYGPYSLDGFKNNLAIKLTSVLNF